MSSALNKQQQKRNGRVALLFGLLGIAVLGFHQLQQHREPQTFEEFVAYVRNKGGILVQCRAQICRDYTTGEIVARGGQDGYYFSYPNEISQQELAYQAELAKKLIGK